MMNASSSSSSRNRSPFTAAQWQELEHQALIFKYMVSGMPIPPDLICSVKRSLDTSMSSRLFPHNPSGWGCFDMGFGRKIDPEPGRCRRTDGKKWRCSKEAYPDSKYCERHMHRGRNRSRKPVEVSSSSSSSSTKIITSTNPSQPNSSINSNLSMSHPNTLSTSSFPFSSLPSSVASESQPCSYPYQSSPLNPFMYAQSTSSRLPASDFSSQNNTTHQLFLDSGSYSHAEKNYRHMQGVRDGVDERAFFPEASGTARNVSDSYQQLTDSRSCKGYSQSHFQSSSDSSKQQQQQQEQHCFVLGNDFKSPRSIKSEKDADTQKPLHHFFEDWPPKNTDSWLDLASNSRIPNDD
ncbi:Growth-regulating factor-like protein [Quillaja saponaria]|uniref:Growth-regulating factor n=1 Tax=Quillaja saponaria TaxID=32244 RepID=A0AAD7L621_QUISA|nr:Growth-regulating factor-like protein [Quillaja saponaria]